jgi:pimeloyl-ACP methyl ester carboxylesterase
MCGICSAFVSATRAMSVRSWSATTGERRRGTEPHAFSHFVALAVPPVAALAAGLFSHAQLKRSFYIYFIQQVGMAEVALLAPGFWESLWADWSPGYDAGEDIAELRRHVTADNIANVVGPYRASFNPQFADPNTEGETLATMQLPPVPTLYLHGADDGAIGADLLGDLGQYFPADGSAAEIVDGVGHFLHLEEPELIAAKIGGWLGV